ncbi:MAG: hypothetical protein ACFE8E_07105 [Candidatus Hodarchaeota archaeon]
MGVDVRSEKNMKLITRKFFKCKHCSLLIEIELDSKVLKQFEKKDQFIIPHLHIHGSPLHGVLCHFDLNGDIRNIEVIKSISISRESNTLQQILDKWSNYF